MTKEPFPTAEFSGSLVKTVKGRQYHAQVFRRDIVYGWNTGMPFGLSMGMRQSKSSGLEKSETWYLLAQ